MGARELIGLEAAISELGGLYAVARRFTALEEEAERGLLPAISRLAAMLRAARRRGGPDADTVDAAAREIAALRESWRRRIGAVREDPVYSAVREAAERADAAALEALLPRLFARVAVHRPSPPLFLEVPLTARRRTPGSPPFRSPESCAERIFEWRDQGIEARDGPDWAPDLPALELEAEPGLLGGPVALGFPPGALPVPVVRRPSDGSYTAYVRRLRAPFVVHLADTAADEWWVASPLPYEAFRDELSERLTARGIAVTTFTP